MKFVDQATIMVKAGDGGNGCISFRREKFVPKGGPDGGDGGDGGSVYLRADKHLQTLYDLKVKPHYKAHRGYHGKGKKMSGKRGTDMYIRVPPGIVVINGETTVGELLNHDETLLIARGGKGGRGNYHFTTSTNRAPEHAERGTQGEERKLQIILKLISDIGLVGLPNSGKSTLLNAMTRARSKVGDYPFTTLNPHLGMLKDDYRRIIIADMPGIIEGAHRGRGLGLQFLRHIERTNLLILVIDIAAAQPLHHYESILEEFRNYSSDLLKKPRVVVFNKVDLVDSKPAFALREKVFYVSALKGQGIQELIAYLTHEDTIKAK
jgi:GTP-binding protein